MEFEFYFATDYLSTPAKCRFLNPYQKYTNDTNNIVKIPHTIFHEAIRNYFLINVAGKVNI